MLSRALFTDIDHSGRALSHLTQKGLVTGQECQSQGFSDGESEKCFKPRDPCPAKKNSMGSQLLIPASNSKVDYNIIYNMKDRCTCCA